MVTELPVKARLIFNFLCVWERKCGYVTPSQGYIARKFGITREHCNRLIRQLREMKLIEVVYRHMRTSIYKVNPLVFSDGIRHTLMRYFLALRYFSLSRLSSFFQGNSQNVTHKYKGSLLGINNINNTPSDRGGRMDNPIPPAVRQVKNIRLSKWGQIMLSGFHPDAIEYADKMLGYAKCVRDPFSWFMQLCKDTSQRDKLPIDWDYVYKLKENYGMKPDAPMLLPLNTSTSLPYARTVSSPSVRATTPPTSGMYKPYVAPAMVSVDKEKELEARKEARETPGWKWLESFLGKKFNPPIPDEVPER